MLAWSTRRSRHRALHHSVGIGAILACACTNMDLGPECDAASPSSQLGSEFDMYAHVVVHD